MSRDDIRFTPRLGSILVVLIVARISTVLQDIRSLDGQIAKAKAYIQKAYSGTVEWIVIQSQGSGENLERRELVQLEEKIESRRIDVVIAEDLSRICRRRRAYDFCELCQDCDTRLIAINDRVDTQQEGWQDAASMATWHHERSNRDTSQRIRRSLRNRFTQGGVFQCPIYGYIKMPGARNDDDVSKDPAAEEIYRAWFHRLDNDATYAEIADWLNALNVSLGPYCRGTEWTGAMVGRITHNTILKGVATHACTAGVR